MKKHLLTMLCLSVAIAAQAQLGTYTANGAQAQITASSDGKTLTIAGHGDISAISQTVTSYIFSSTGAANVYLQSANQGNVQYTSVTNGTAFSGAMNTYYKEVPGTMTAITIADDKTIGDTDYSAYFSSVSTTTTEAWVESKLTSEPIYQGGLGNNGMLAWKNKVDKSWSLPGANDTYYVQDDNGTIEEYYDGTTTTKYTKLTKQDLITRGYITSTSTTTFTAASDLYCSTDGGTTKTKITANSTGNVYNPQATYYYAAPSTYTLWDGDVTGDVTTLEALFLSNGYITSQSEQKTMAEIIAAAVSGGTYETVEMMDDGTDAAPATLTITPAITQAVLAQGGTANSHMTLLDLTKTTLTTADKAFSSTNTALLTLRLPKTISQMPTADASAAENTYKHIDLSALTGLKYLNIKATCLTDAQVLQVQKANNTTLTVMDMDGLSYERLFARYGSEGHVKNCNVFSKQNTPEGEPTEMDMYINKFDEILLGKYGSGYDNLVITSPLGSVSTQEHMTQVLQALNSVTDVTNVSFTKNPSYNQIAYDLTALTNTAIKRILLPDISNEETGTGTKYLKSIINATHQPILQVYNSQNEHETIYSPSAGQLAAIQHKHYFNPDIENAYWQHYVGKFNAQDVLFLNGAKNSRLDLADVEYDDNTTSGKDALLGLTNQVVEYLAFPDLGGAPEDATYSKVFQQCPKLLAAGQYISTGELNLLNVATAAQKSDGTSGEGKVKEIVEMLKTKIGGINPTNNEFTLDNSYIKRIKYSGPVNALDLFAQNDTYQQDGFLASDGHIHFLEAVDEYAATQARTPQQVAGSNEALLKTGTLSGCRTLVSIDLENATFSHIDDLTLSALGLVSNTLIEVKIPTGVTELPADFLIGATALHSLCIPGNIEKIHARAFAGVDLMHVWTTGTDESIAYDRGVAFKTVITTTTQDNQGNDVVTTTDGERTTLYHGTDQLTRKFHSDNADHKLFVDLKEGDDAITVPDDARWVYGTIVLPYNLNFVGTAAFSGTQHIRDVYCLNTVAPQCNVDAFSSKTLCANNSCDNSQVTATGEVKRDCYQKADEGEPYYTAVLHFPKECTDNEARLYTDITREYSIASELTDGNGKTRYLPTMAEWNRAFTQGTTGYLWKAFSLRRNGLYGSAQGFLNANGSTISLQWSGWKQYKYQEEANKEYANNGSPTPTTNLVFYDTSVAAQTETHDDGTTTQIAAQDALSYNTTLYNKDYRGWHQFVLSDYSSTSKEEEIVTSFTNFADNDWWTICQHFPMTVAELKQVFGNDVILLKLKAVTRDIQGKTITLQFGHNLINDGDVTTGDGQGYCLQAGVPYLIKPSMSTEDRNEPGAMTLHYAKNADNYTTYNLARFEEKPAEEREKLLIRGMQTVPAFVTNNTGTYTEPTKTYDQDNTKSVHSSLDYTMIGSFYKFYLPRYCYFLGVKKSDKKVAYFWNSENVDYDRTKYQNWGEYTCVIAPNFIHKSKKEADYKDVFYQPTGFATVRWNYTAVDGHASDIGATDDFGSSNGSQVDSGKRFTSIIYQYDDEDKGTTQIDFIHGLYNGGIEAGVNAPVYNLNGQKMNSQSLPKGVYISNGRKFINK